MKSIKEYLINESSSFVKWAGDQVVVMNDGGSLTGVIGGYAYPRDLAKDEMELSLLYIKADKRNSSYGSELVKALCDEADKKQLNLVVFAEPINNEVSKDKLIAFYKKFGFVTDEEVSDNNDGACMIRKTKS